MKVITYARFSSVGQKDGTSIERQVELAEAYAKAKNWSISEIITDEGKSAFHAAHKRKSGGLGRIFERVKSGDIGAGDVLIVESVDRLSREDVMTALDSFLELMTSGLTVVTTMDGRELNKSNYTSQWSDIIVLIAKMAAAHEESAKRSERGLDIWKRRRARGVLTCRHPAWFNEDGSINPLKAKVVREIFAMAINGHGTGSIAKILNERGEPSWSDKRGANWHSVGISKMLRNRTLIGERQPMHETGEVAGETVIGYYEPLLDHDTFNRAQASIQSRAFGAAGSGRAGKGVPNLFRSLVKCGWCGSAMVVKNNHDATAKTDTYLCSNSRVSKCDHTRRYNVRIFEKAVIGSLIELKIDDNNSVERDLRAEIAAIKNEIATKTQNREFLIDKMLELDSPALTARFKTVEAEIVELEAKLKAVDQKLVSEVDPMSKRQASLANLFERLYDESQPEDEITALRQSVSAALRTLLFSVRITPHNTATVTVKNGTSYILAYRFKGRVPLLHKKRSANLLEHNWLVERYDEDRVRAAVNAQVFDQAMLDQAGISTPSSDLMSLK